MAARKKSTAKKKTRKTAKKAARKTTKTPARAVKKTKAKKKAAPARAKAPARKTGASAKAGATKKKQASKKKAPARKKKQIVGEGDYEASRAFLKDQAGFVQKNKAKIPGLGKQARAALEGSEGPALLAAEAEARSHSKGDSAEEQ